MKKDMQAQIPGQLTIDEMLLEFAKAKEVMVSKAKEVVASSVTEFSSAKERVLSSAEDYLKKGERLTSMAREKFERILKGYSFDKIEESLYKLEVPDVYKREKFVDEIAKKVVRPLLRDMTDGSEEDASVKALRRLIDIPFSLKRVEKERVNYACRSLRNYDKRSDDIVYLNIMEEGWPVLTIYGYRLYKHSSKKRTKNILFYDDTTCGDIALALSYLICLTLFRRAMEDEELRPRIRERWSKRSVFIVSFLDWTRLTFAKMVELLAQMKDAVDRKGGVIQLNCMRFFRPQEASILFLQELLGGVDVETLLVPKEVAKRENKLFDGDTVKFIVNEGLNRFLYNHDPCKAFDKGVVISYNSLLYRTKLAEDLRCSENIPQAWPLPKSHAPCFDDIWDVVHTALEALWENKAEALQTASYLRSLASGGKHAKAYQTKKNIPEKVMKAMQESEFNSYFGYVEFDQDVDVGSAAAIADEFIAFKETYLPGLVTERVTLRFRRLGNHKATGLYYPSLGCLCVDINNPSSFIHEYGHCIDREAEEGIKALSDKKDFYPVYARYKILLNDYADKASETMQKRLKGTSKYNLDYYLLHTESFARCFEMYVTRTLGMTNSICKQLEDDSFAYPLDDELMKLIKDYFDQLFLKLNQCEVAEERVAA